LEERASVLADELVEVLGIVAPPVDPFAIAANETPLLKLRGGDFKNRLDGLLRYYPQKDRYVLFYNTRLDGTGWIHPRTRFSVGHELGHFYIPEHRALLRRRGGSHRSHSEFSSKSLIERQADAFAASLLMPTRLMRKSNRAPLTAAAIGNLAKQFAVSPVSMAIRAVRTSQFPCAAVGYRSGRPAWQFLSPMLVEGKCFPRSKDAVGSSKATEHWRAFADGTLRPNATADSRAENWFMLCGRALAKEPWVTEHFIGIGSRDTMLVVLTIDEGDLFDLDED